MYYNLFMDAAVFFQF